MGKRTRSQRKGKGSPTYRSPIHRSKPNTEYPSEWRGEVTSIEHDPARNAPIGKLKSGESTRYMIIPEGVSVGDEITIGGNAPVGIGNTLSLSQIPDGSLICNVENRPGDGGSAVRSSGTYATLLAKEGDTALIKLPSGVKKRLDSRCKATIGVVAGGGRKELPFVKAGKKYMKMKSKSGKYPRVSGVAMNPVDHPFGGGGHQHVGKPKTVSKGAPPGRKVGNISSKKSKRRRRK